jgi:hypothetical protein
MIISHCFEFCIITKYGWEMALKARKSHCRHSAGHRKKVCGKVATRKIPDLQDNFSLPQCPKFLKSKLEYSNKIGLTLQEPFYCKSKVTSFDYTSIFSSVAGLKFN